jgi:erythromycin esterase-like protein
MGGYLNKWYGNSYYSLAITVLSGEYTAIADSGLSKHNILSEPVKDSYEYSFKNIKDSTFFINFSDIDDRNKKFLSGKKLRELGSMAHEYQFKNYNLITEFDGIVIIKYSLGTNVLF